MKIRIREGNDFDVVWAIKRAGVPEDLSTAINMKLTLVVYGLVIEHELFTVTDNLLSINIPKEVATVIGDYRLIFEYTFPDAGQPDGDLKCKTDVVPFRIVPFTAKADDIYTINVTSDIAFGFKGDKGDDGDDAYQIWLDLGNVGTYEDFIAYLRQPAVDAGASISELEGEIQVSEGLRVQAESERDLAEGTRVQSESERLAAEIIRQSNEGDRIEDEAIRVQNEAERISEEGIRQSNETDRVEAEGIRQSNEIDRIEAEGIRVQAESERQTTIQEAVTATNLANEKANLANTAAQNANEAAGLADTARTELTTAVNTKLGEADDKIEEMDATLSTYDGRVTQVESDISQLAGEVSLLDAVQGAKIKDIENVISTMNPNQSAQLSVTGTSPLSLPKNAANSGMSVKLEGLTEDVGGVITNFDPTGRVRSVDKNGLNPTSLYITAPELRSNGTVKDEIRKGANGYELVKRVGVGTLGAELITNAADREFSSSDGWSLGGTSEISGGTLKINFSTSSQESSKVFPSIRDETNSRYFLASFDLISLNHPTNLRFMAGTSGKLYTISTTKAGQRVYILFLGWGVYGTGWRSAGSVTAEIDNFSIKEVTFASESTPSVGALWQTDDLQVIGTTAIHCTAATPVISPVSYGGVLNSAENGTVYHEPVIADAGVYGTNMPILLTDYPIASIEEIIKHENGIDTYLDVSTAVIAGDKLSFTHPSLQSGDLVLFTYRFDKESTNGNITATFYDSNVVKIDTVTGKAYKITDIVTNGVLTRTLTEV